MFFLFLIKLLIGTVLYLTGPRTLFPEACSTLLYSSDGQLLGARIAPDGQWRFPPADTLPDKFVTCLLTYEDKRFYQHPGVDPTAIARAMRTNLSRGKIVSGGSTITMQLARIARGNRNRTLYEKMIETGYALLLETACDKHEILNLYASHAPFGGNVVGIETAAWRYFGRSAADLSWAESATLAVLPNSPALIHPGRNRARLKTKRDKLLTVLKEKGILDETEYELSLLEPLPEAPIPLPDEAPHLLERLAADAPGTRITTSVNRMLQRQAQEIVNRYARDYASNHIHNLAALIANAETGEVLAYAGNVTFKADARKGNQVDIITSPRSTGSILKPFLYAAMLHDGQLLPGTLVPDVPLNLNGFSPQNYNKTFYGAVPAHRAIERSLNVPLVRMLSTYNTGRFMSLLKKMGMTTLRFSEEHYGASLILGGAEGTLWDLTGMYASLARTLAHYRIYNGRYNPADIHPLTPFPASPTDPLRSVTDKRLTDKPWRTRRLGDRDDSSLYGGCMCGKRFRRRPAGTDWCRKCRSRPVRLVLSSSGERLVRHALRRTSPDGSLPPQRTQGLRDLQPGRHALYASLCRQNGSLPLPPACPSFRGRPLPGEQFMRVGRPDDRMSVVRTASFRRILLPELSYRLRAPTTCETRMRRGPEPANRTDLSGTGRYPLPPERFLRQTGAIRVQGRPCPPGCHPLLASRRNLYRRNDGPPPDQQFRFPWQTPPDINRQPRQSKDNFVRSEIIHFFAHYS